MKKFDHSRFLIAVKYLLDGSFVKNKRELSSVFNISASKLSEILNERMNPGFDLYEILVSDFNISSEWLLTGNGNMLKKDSLSNKGNYFNKSIKKNKNVEISNNVFEIEDSKNKETIKLLNKELELCKKEVELLKRENKLLQKENNK